MKPMPPDPDREVVSRWVSRLKERSKTFKAGTNHAKLLDLYLSRFPETATNEEASKALGGTSPNVPINRLIADMQECFTNDRFLWLDQQMLVLSDTGPNQTHKLQLQPLWKTLSPSIRIWFHHCMQVPAPRKKEWFVNTPEPQPFIVISEPLFFFAPSLGAYFRFLDMNHDTLFRPDETRLIAEARIRLGEIFPQILDSDSARDPITDLPLVPVRLYLPAGDSYAKTAIRRWFRNTMKHRVGYKSASAVSIPDSVNSNLIVLASRSSLPLLTEFQHQNQPLLQLTKDGISFKGEILKDQVSPHKGTTLSYAIVTNWTLETGKVHTYIASNHTRAIEAVVNLLVGESELLKDLSEALVVDGKIPGKFQVAFEVSLHLHETNANVERLLPHLDGKPLRY